MGKKGFLNRKPKSGSRTKAQYEWENSHRSWGWTKRQQHGFCEDEVFLSAPETALRSVALRTGSLTFFLGGGRRVGRQAARAFAAEKAQKKIAMLYW